MPNIFNFSLWPCDADPVAAAAWIPQRLVGLQLKDACELMRCAHLMGQLLPTTDASGVAWIANMLATPQLRTELSNCLIPCDREDAALLVKLFRDEPPPLVKRFHFPDYGYATKQWLLWVRRSATNMRWVELYAAALLKRFGKSHASWDQLTVAIRTSRYTYEDAGAPVHSIFPEPPGHSSVSGIPSPCAQLLSYLLPTHICTELGIVTLNQVHHLFRASDIWHNVRRKGVLFADHNEYVSRAMVNDFYSQILRWPRFPVQLPPGTTQPAEDKSDGPAFLAADTHNSTLYYQQQVRTYLHKHKPRGWRRHPAVKMTAAPPGSGKAARKPGEFRFFDRDHGPASRDSVFRWRFPEPQYVDPTTVPAPAKIDF